MNPFMEHIFSFNSYFCNTFKPLILTIFLSKFTLITKRAVQRDRLLSAIAILLIFLSLIEKTKLKSEAQSISQSTKVENRIYRIWIEK